MHSPHAHLRTRQRTKLPYRRRQKHPVEDQQQRGRLHNTQAQASLGLLLLPVGQRAALRNVTRVKWFPGQGLGLGLGLLGLFCPPPQGDLLGAIILLRWCPCQRCVTQNFRQASRKLQKPVGVVDPDNTSEEEGKSDTGP